MNVGNGKHLVTPLHGFVVLPGHEDEEIESVVEKHDRFYVVEKSPGGPAEIARENDPRV